MLATRRRQTGVGNAYNDTCYNISTHSQPFGKCFTIQYTTVKVLDGVHSSFSSLMLQLSEVDHKLPATYLRDA